ncbi:MAG: nucleotidyl transferase AbiEii/AbiGii toxin family protein, partial [Betaproteobacteria bacterium]|nr:nucleotidyl transferase AbiEii/AbiGii toxin family protein [Betaproteobacteria bacterium]
MINKEVIKQRMGLLLQLLPHVYEQASLALKGGTAINAVLRDLPRLSVDIDLAYVNLSRRKQALEDIICCLQNIREKAGLQMIDATFFDLGSKGKMLVRQYGVDVRIEVNQVMRGTVFAPRQAYIHDAAAAAFSQNVYPVKILDPDEIYAGKLVAMLARRHPRDLFDVYHLLADQGIHERMLDAFIVYLSANKRPMHKLLDSENSMTVNQSAYESILEMMTAKPVSRQYHARNLS